MGNIVLKEDTPDRGEIGVYQPDDVTRLEVRVNEDSNMHILHNTLSRYKPMQCLI